MNKIPVTIIIPVKNEALHIRKCLECLLEFSEVIIVDSGSTDNTLEIIKEFDVRLINFVWNGSFPKKRNWVLLNHTFSNDWILFLDADEYLSENFISEIKDTIANTSNVAFWLNYSTYFMGRKLKFGDRMKKLAFFRKGSALYERIEDNNWSDLDMEVHEHPIVNGKVGTIKSIIEHRDFGDLAKYIKKHDSYSTWEAKRFMNLNSEYSHLLNFRQKIKYYIMSFGLSPFVYFVYSYFIKLGFLDGRRGLYFASYKAFYYFMIQSKITELKYKNNK